MKLDDCKDYFLNKKIFTNMNLRWDNHKIEIRRNFNDNYDISHRHNFSEYGVNSKFVLNKLNEISNTSVDIQIN